MLKLYLQASCKSLNNSQLYRFYYQDIQIGPSSFNEMIWIQKQNLSAFFFRMLILIELYL